jgi:hypothetical protein
VTGGKPIALAEKSYYKSSPLGNEAATRTFGGSILTPYDHRQLYPW